MYHQLVGKDGDFIVGKDIGNFYFRKQLKDLKMRILIIGGRFESIIRFLGILSLLIVFEFINLLLHPYFGELVHHSPVLMLCVMVAIAALLIPLHHKLEHWITDKLVEKNNGIRLAAAKRIIEKIEGNKPT